MTRNEIIEVAKGFYTDYFSEREIAFARLIIKQAEKLRQWQGLTDEEIQTAWDSMHHDPAAFVHFAGGALWAEAKCKEKNT